ncbi:MAG TPA: hypothetical protein VJT14_02980 [Candidatus Dormibacteraeota bacterium]|nr:hypothetical protein [Candidatus Dormibacteraeota bacterium]
MGLNGHQLYVWEGSVDRVTELIKRYVKEVGCAAAVDFESDKPSPAMARRTQREFTLSGPRDGIICIWEDGAWGDRRLARYLSKQLETRSIWLALSSVTDQWAYVIYANGAVADSKIDTTDEYYEKAGEFARRHKLPYALIYLPEPAGSMASDVAEFKKQFGTDWLHSEPEVDETEIEHEIMDDPAPEDAAEIQAEAERAKQQADVAKFPKLTIPCK